MAKSNISLTKLLGAMRAESGAETVAEQGGNGFVTHQFEPRPSGTLVWLHAENMRSVVDVSDLTGRLHRMLPNLNLLVTVEDSKTDSHLKPRFPEYAHQAIAVGNSSRAIQEFLDHWQPDLCLWAQPKLVAPISLELQHREIPTVFVNAELKEKPTGFLRWLSGSSHNVLDGFSAVLAVNLNAANQFARLGCPKEKLIITGALQESAVALEHNEQTRAKLARKLDGRPTWLGVHIARDEASFILDAQKSATRATHRLLLILSPENPEDVAMINTKCLEKGLASVRSSAIDQMTQQTDVLLVDEPDKLGLWYRLATVAFIGGSLTEHGGHTPFDAAALGSAILHGPHVSSFADIYQRFNQAKAAVEVRDPHALAKGITACITPDKAAEMAHAGWEICSDGAEVTDRALEVVLDLLPQGDAA